MQQRISMIAISSALKVKFFLMYSLFRIHLKASTFFSLISSLFPTTRIKKIGLETTGHYSYILLGFLLNNGLPTYVLNPLHTNLYRKSLSLRKTKTDKVDARVIASMLMSCAELKPYTNTLYHKEELKSPTRYRFDKVSERARLKSSVSRLVNIFFLNLRNSCPHCI